MVLQTRYRSELIIKLKKSLIPARDHGDWRETREEEDEEREEGRREKKMRRSLSDLYESSDETSFLREKSRYYKWYWSQYETGQGVQPNPMTKP
ncbi:hypothetical protein TorRG33x02_091240 [Trema orientale]|uniref:Uncharacterized protein n=1 Tax=Trema orientale TaxID=63057 RepID=A0A2P5FAW0_TREOI|nr:hypothetical protein TorRG33x02_091240 [Trema orientale]